MDQTVQALGRQQQASCQGGIFVPVQDSSAMWQPQDALVAGTIFPCLYSPYEKGENNYG